MKFNLSITILILTITSSFICNMASRYKKHKINNSLPKDPALLKCLSNDKHKNVSIHSKCACWRALSRHSSHRETAESKMNKLKCSKDKALFYESNLNEPKAKKQTLSRCKT